MRLSNSSSSPSCSSSELPQMEATNNDSRQQHHNDGRHDDVDSTNHKVHFDLNEPVIINNDKETNDDADTSFSPEATWLSSEELEQMKAGDEFVLMKQSFSNFARCRCCKGYKLCRGLELRCPINVEQRNTKIQLCREKLFELQSSQRQKRRRQQDHKGGGVRRQTSSDETIALKYQELCATDVEEALKIGKLDAEQAQLMMETSEEFRCPQDDETYLSIKSKSRSFRKQNNGNHSFRCNSTGGPGGGGGSDSFRCNSGNNVHSSTTFNLNEEEDDEDYKSISELSFDGSIRHSNKKSNRRDSTDTRRRKARRNGGGHFLRRTGRFIVRVVKGTRIR